MTSVDQLRTAAFVLGYDLAPQPCGGFQLLAHDEDDDGDAVLPAPLKAEALARWLAAAHTRSIAAKAAALADGYESGGLAGMQQAGARLCNWSPELCAALFEEGRRRADRLLVAEQINFKDHGDGRTLGDIVAELVRLSDDRDAFCDYIDEQFLGGAWAEVWQALNDNNAAALKGEAIVPRFAASRTFARDIRGMCLALARVAARALEGGSPRQAVDEVGEEQRS